MAGHYGNAILLSICRSLIVFSLSFAVSMPFTMILTVRTLMGGSAETSLAEYLLLTACTTLLSIFTGVFQTGITLFYLNTACSRPAVTANLFYGFKYLFLQVLQPLQPAEEPGGRAATHSRPRHHEWQRYGDCQCKTASGGYKVV